MDSRKFVFKETAIVLLGEAVGTGAMFGVFAMLHAFNPGVLYGGLLGAFLSVANFFVMAVCGSMAADKAVAQDVKGGQRILQISQLARYLLLFVIPVFAITLVALLCLSLEMRPIVRSSGKGKAALPLKCNASALWNELKPVFLINYIIIIAYWLIFYLILLLFAK